MKMSLIIININCHLGSNQIEVILTHSVFEKKMKVLTQEQLLLLEPQFDSQIRHQLIENLKSFLKKTTEKSFFFKEWFENGLKTNSLLRKFHPSKAQFKTASKC